MSRKNIKGITIELDGNSTKLESALKDVNGASRDLQSELREVDRLLKFDPKNTDLLAQRQKILADSVDQTRKRLDTLKEAERQVEQQFARGEVGEEQYRAIQREVAKAEQDLKSLEGQLTKVNRKWADAAKGIDNFGKKMGSAGRSLMPASAAAGAAGVAAVKMAINFDDAIAKVSTIADTTEVPLDKLRKDIVEASNITGVAAEQIADDVYNAISAGQATGDAVQYVVQANKLAQAGFAEQAQALDIMTTIQNAYGMSAEETERIMDVLINTQNKGKVTVGELSSVMGKVIPTANAANVGLEELGAAYAILTANGIAAAESTTYTNSMLNELSKSGSTSSKALKNETGKSFQDLMAEGKSLADVLEILSGVAQKEKLNLADMFGSAEAAKAANVIMKESGGTYRDLLQSMKDSSGATDEAFEKMQTDSKEFAKTLNEIKNAAMEVGNALSPVFEMIADMAKEAAAFLSGLTDEQKELLAKVLIFVAALAPALIILSKVAGGISALMVAMQSLGPVIGVVKIAMAALLGPVGLVIAAIAAVIAIGVLLYKNMDTIKETAAKLGASLKENLGKAKDGLMNAFKGMLDGIKKIWGSVKGFFKSLPGQTLQFGKDIINGLIRGITGMVGKVRDGVKNIAGTITGGFKKLLGINSPSKVFEEYGKYTGEGFIQGIDKTRKAVEGITADLGTSALGGISGVRREEFSGVMRIQIEGSGVKDLPPDGLNKLVSSVESALASRLRQDDRRIANRVSLATLRG